MPSSPGLPQQRLPGVEVFIATFNPNEVAVFSDRDRSMLQLFQS